MPSDPFYGGTGVEVLYPNDIMNTHFSEPDWNPANPVCSVSYFWPGTFVYGVFAGTSWPERL